MSSKFVYKLYMAKFFLLTFLLLTTSFLLAQERPEGLFINSKAPDFKATDQYGKEIRLKDVLKDSLVVLIFYRGQWCPYCNRQLKKLEDSLQLIKDKRAKLIAVTPEKTESRYKNADIDLATANGQKDKVYLPVPAIYIINKESTIIYRFFDADYKKRPAVKDIL